MGHAGAHPPPPPRRIRVGVCARDKKAHSKPMREILSRFDAHLFDIIIFGDDNVLHQPVEKWPVVDCLMSWFSHGFPLEKAEAYVRLRQPFCINDLATEYALRDRRQFYSILERNGIPTPNHVVLDRDRPGPKPVVIETEDTVQVDGVKISKPFVEKPVDAEDHNIYIYYPRRLGGGSKRLFRKVGNVSSKFYADVSTIRPEGSYIYEEFLMTQGTDIKIYVVGPDYAHAEARKSPVVDGIVQRDEEGKEVRFPIMLTHKEKDIARRVCLAFRQNVCGFDLLRTAGQSYVCDVNGWSFVKKSHKYYDDASQLLQLMMMRAVAPQRLHTSILLHTSPPAGLPSRFFRPTGGMGGPMSLPIRPAMAPGGAPSLRPSTSTTSRTVSPTSMSGGNGGVCAGLPMGGGSASAGGGPGMPDEELRCVAAVIRHGDRTPKQKLKMVVTHPDFLILHRRFAKRPRDEAKLKSAAQLQAVLSVTRQLIAARANAVAGVGCATSGGSGSGGGVPPEGDCDTMLEDLDKLLQVKAVLEKGGHFSGINRKVQLKPTKWRTLNTATPPKAAGGEVAATAAAGDWTIPHGTDPSAIVAGGTGESLLEPPMYHTLTAASINRVLHQQHRPSSSGSLHGGGSGSGALPTPSTASSRHHHGHSTSTPTMSRREQLVHEVEAEIRSQAGGGGGGDDEVGVPGHRVHRHVSAGAAIPAPAAPVGAPAPGEGNLPSIASSLSLTTATAAARPALSPVILKGRALQHTPSGLLVDSSDEVEAVEVVECMLVLKWGGVLTHAGREQAEALGQRFRSIMYPGESVGLLRLHSTYRHDLKIYSSDEGRVQMTAAAFVKGFLDLEGELTPILASLVRTINTSNLLDDSVAARGIIDSLKERLKRALTTSPGMVYDSAADTEVEATCGGRARARRGGSGCVDEATLLADADRTLAAHYALSDMWPHTSAPGGSDGGNVGGGGVHDEMTAVLRRCVRVPTRADIAALVDGLDDRLVELIAPTHAASLLTALHRIGPNPRATLLRIHALIESLVNQLVAMVGGAGGGATSTSPVPPAPSLLAAPSTSSIVTVTSGVDGCSNAGSLTATTPTRATGTALPSPSSCGGGGTSDASVVSRLPPRHKFRDSEIERMVRTQYMEHGDEEEEEEAAATGGGGRGEGVHAPTHRASLGVASSHGLETATPGAVPDACTCDTRSSASAAAPGPHGATLPSMEDDASSPRDQSNNGDLCCSGETLWLMCARWKKLWKDFYKPRKGMFDLSKIPDIADQVQYDCLHNSNLGLADLPELYRLSKAFADVVVQQEYGITAWEKKDIAARVCHHLLRKLFFDMTAVQVEDTLETEQQRQAELLQRQSPKTATKPTNASTSSLPGVAGRTNGSSLSMKASAGVTTTVGGDNGAGGDATGAGGEDTVGLPLEVEGGVQTSLKPSGPLPSMPLTAPSPPGLAPSPMPVDGKLGGAGALKPAVAPPRVVASVATVPPTHSAPASCGEGRGDATTTHAATRQEPLPATAAAATAEPANHASPPILHLAWSHAPRWASPLTGLVVTLRHHAHADAARRRRRSAPGLLAPGLHTNERALWDATDRVGHVNPAIGPSLIPHAGSGPVPPAAVGAGAWPTWWHATHPADTAHAGLPPVTAGTAHVANTHPATSTAPRGSGPSSLHELPHPAAFAASSVRRVVAGSGGVTTVTTTGNGAGGSGVMTSDVGGGGAAGGDEEGGGETCSTVTSATSYERAMGGPVLVPGFRVRQRAMVAIPLHPSSQVATAGAAVGPLATPVSGGVPPFPPGAGSTRGEGSGGLDAIALPLPIGPHGLDGGGSMSSTVRASPVTSDHGGASRGGASRGGGVSADGGASVTAVSPVDNPSPSHLLHPTPLLPSRTPSVKGHAGADEPASLHDGGRGGAAPTSMGSTPASPPVGPIPPSSMKASASSTSLGALSEMGSGASTTGVGSGNGAGGGTGASSKMSAIMAAIAEDLHDVSETVHQLDARFMSDSGYGEVKTPTRHVRTRLYFTSESHVHALINTVKHWAFSPEGEAGGSASTPLGATASPPASPMPGASTGGGGPLSPVTPITDGATPKPSPASGPGAASGQPAPITHLTTAESLAVLEATPELDYLTHIVFRLYENFTYPPGHPRRHRVEILFSPGASYSPFDGAPRTPRLAGTGMGGLARQRGPSDVSQPPLDLGPTTLLSLGGEAATAPSTTSSRSVAGHGLPFGRGDGGDGTSMEGFDVEVGGDVDAASVLASTVADLVGGSGGSATELGTDAVDDGFGGTSQARGPCPGHASPLPTDPTVGTASAFVDIRPPAATVYDGPTVANVTERERHTLPVAPVMPIHLNLTLNELEDVLAEAIYYGATLQEMEIKEHHPKDEARARAAAAVAKAKKSAADGYFLK